MFAYAGVRRNIRLESQLARCATFTHSHEPRMINSNAPTVLPIVIDRCAEIFLPSAVSKLSSTLKISMSQTRLAHSFTTTHKSAARVASDPGTCGFAAFERQRVRSRSSGCVAESELLKIT